MLQIGDIIRRERKAHNLTQEEMARLLGVTAPAVNKWEKGGSLPDITLLAPIARLLEISLDELLSFRSQLTQAEVEEKANQLDQLLESDPFVFALDWAKKQLEDYPNCGALRLNLTMLIDAAVVNDPEKAADAADQWIEDSYRRLLQSEEESLHMSGAERLYDFYFARQRYDDAQTVLNHFSDQNPEKKRKQAELFRRMGEEEKAVRMEEELLFSLYKILSRLFDGMEQQALRLGQTERATSFTDKRKKLIRLFEMGDYASFAVDLEPAIRRRDVETTLQCVRGMLGSVDSLFGFTRSPLYAHMTFKQPDPAFLQSVRQNLIEGFRTDEALDYMRNDARWIEMLDEC